MGLFLQLLIAAEERGINFQCESRVEIQTYFQHMCNFLCVSGLAVLATEQFLGFWVEEWSSNKFW